MVSERMQHQHYDTLKAKNNNCQVHLLSTFPANISQDHLWNFKRQEWNDPCSSSSSSQCWQK